MSGLFSLSDLLGLGSRSEVEGPNSGIGDTALTPEVTLAARLERYVRAVRDGDEAMVEEAVFRLSSSRRLFAPLAFLASGIVTLFDGLKLLVSNWRLTLVQIVPAV